MTRKQILLLAAAVAALVSISIPAQAVPIFSQTPASNVGAVASDADPGQNTRFADDFTLGAAATARSVTWRGVFSASNTPDFTFPVPFDLTIYNDNAGVPGTVLSTTPVMFNAIGDFTDTGVDLGNLDVFEFQADLTATPLAAGTTYWFSPLANTINDADDNWAWTTSGGDSAAQQLDVAGNGPWAPAALGPFYFVLDDESIGGATGNAVPEPISAALGLMGLATLAVATRRRAA